MPRLSLLRVGASCAAALATVGGSLLAAAAPPGDAGPSHSPTTASPRDGHASTDRHSAQTMNETVLWSEDFDRQADATGFTHRAPRGWSIVSSGFRTGEARWAGWAFTNIRDWTWAVGTERRHWFTGAHNTFAVVESSHQRLARRDRMTTDLSTPAIRVRGEHELSLRFDSHYAQGKAPQNGAVYVSFDGAARRPLVRYTADRLSSHEAVDVRVPVGAHTARFTFGYEKAHNDAWWAIDNVELTRSLKAPTSRPVATVDVMSDAHLSGGPKADPNRVDTYRRALALFARQPDRAGALALAGDVVDLGQAADYTAAAHVLRSDPHPSGRTILVAGNHEFLGKEGSAVYQKRFLALAARRTPWGEVDVNGIPILAISTEYYSDADRAGVEPYVRLGRRQLAWLSSRLAHYARTGTPVLVMNHHPLPQSVSFTHSAYYGNDFADLSALNRVIAKYDNILYLSGHTHAWYGLNDWWGRYRVNGSGNPSGFPAVNTGALLNAGVPDGDNDEKTLPGRHATALRVKVYRDRLRLEAWDVIAGKMMKFQDLPVTTRFARAR